jgi:hypothetical protein
MADFTDFIVGWFNESSFYVFTHNAPRVNEIILIREKKYSVYSVFDDTTEEEFESGLSFSKVCVNECEETQKLNVKVSLEATSKINEIEKPYFIEYAKQMGLLGRENG